MTQPLHAHVGFAPRIFFGQQGCGRWSSHGHTGRRAFREVTAASRPSVIHVVPTLKEGGFESWARDCAASLAFAVKPVGKRKSSGLRKGSPWLKTLLVQCGWAAARKKDSYYKAQFNRLRGRHGAEEAWRSNFLSSNPGSYQQLQKLIKRVHYVHP